MKVDEFVADWTPEEREALKDLIDECRQREKRIEESEKLSLRDLKRMADEIVGDLVDRLYPEKYGMKC